MTSHEAQGKVLVTGGAGFIGANLCRRLLDEDHMVICIDNLSSGRAKNVSPLLGSDAFEFVEADVRDGCALEQIGPVSHIFNLACPASPPFYQADPIGTLTTCVFGAQNVLELARRTGARILQASTSEVYGDPTVHPQSEDYRGNVNPIGPRACYDEGKRAAEALFFDYHRQHGVDIRVVRIFNTFGPLMRKDDGRVVSNFISQALSGDDITVYGDGSQTRSPCYVDDMVDALVAMMQADDFTGPVNLGNPEEVTVLELAEKVLEMTGSSSGIVFCDLPKDDPVRRRPDITLARKKLGWEPRTTLEEGLERSIAYFRGLLA